MKACLLICISREIQISGMKGKMNYFVPIK